MTYKVKLTDSRVTKYFANQLDFKNEYLEIAYFLNQNRGKAGLVIKPDTWEYPFYHTIFFAYVEVVPHVNGSDFSKNAIRNARIYYSKMQYIVSDSKEIYIEFNHQTYYYTKTSGIFQYSAVGVVRGKRNPFS